MRAILALLLLVFPAVSVPHPRGLAPLPSGGYLVAEPFANQVQEVAPDGAVTTVAGTGTAGFSGDGGPATEAELNLPHAVALLPDGSFLIADTLNHRIRQVDPDGTIHTVVGTGQAGYTGDGIPAVHANLRAPRGLAAYPDGRYLIADTEDNRIRLVDRDGLIHTVAGPTGLHSPYGVAITPDGGFVVADYGHGRVVRFSAGGHATVVASGLREPHNVAALPDGSILVAETGANRIDRLWPDGTRTVASTGLDQPKAVSVLPGNLDALVGDSANDRVLVLPLALGLTAPASIDSPRLRFSLSADASVTATARNGKRTVRAVERGRAGANSIALSVGPGIWSVHLVAKAGQRSAVADLRLSVR
jgi:sugar lactone lactonase YvrE